MDTMQDSQELPVREIIPALKEALRSGRGAVLQSPPGSGKTTLVPPSLLDEEWLEGRTILMLEPRRIAARAAAERIAYLLGERVGERAGYSIRFERVVSAKTRIEVVTEGILTRRIQQDPALAGVGLLIFDEIHERSLHGDLGLALALECREAFRDDLRILAMSATLDAPGIAELLGAPVIRGEGRSHPVEIRYRPAGERDLYRILTDTVASLLREGEGDLLVFLPGAREIRRTLRDLEEGLDRAGLLDRVVLRTLYGELPFAEQKKSLAPDPSGKRKVILSTNVAETSLTIDGVHAVVDTGLARFSRYDPSTGMSRLVTDRIAMDSALQRAGRAGRQGPGLCVRLWPREEESHRRRVTTPEILEADLSSFVLEAALWGTPPEELSLADAPPAASLSRARELLFEAGALDADWHITERGRRMVLLPLHPRLASMVLRGEERGASSAASLLAALLTEREILPSGSLASGSCDLSHRMEILAEVRDEGADAARGHGADAVACARAIRTADEIEKRIVHRARGAKSETIAGGEQHVKGEDGGKTRARTKQREEGSSGISIGALLSFAYPDRIAFSRGKGDGRYLLRSGRGAYLAKSDPLCRESFLAVAETDGEIADARIFAAAPITKEEILLYHGSHLEEREELHFSEESGSLIRIRESRLGALVIESRRETVADPDLFVRSLLRWIREKGIGVLPWNEEASRLRKRMDFLRRHGEDLPDTGDGSLLEHLEEWLLPFLSGMDSLSALKRLDLVLILKSMLGREQLLTLEREAPESFLTPAGSRILLEYEGGEAILSVKLQELFGMAETPRLARGREAVTLHLLSPARRPIQITRDLKGFWDRTYPQVKKELMGRYPKHPWPDDPWSAPPARGTKKQGF